MLGGLFWTLAFFAANTKASYANFVYTLPEVDRAVMYALVPLVLTIAVFVLGCSMSASPAVVLLLVAAAWCCRASCPAPRRGRLWVTAVACWSGPTIAAAILYFFAARTQEYQELKKGSTAV